MNNWAKLAIILGISFLAFIIEAGASFTLMILLLYFEFIDSKRRK